MSKVDSMVIAVATERKKCEGGGNSTISGQSCRKRLNTYDTMHTTAKKIILIIFIHVGDSNIAVEDVNNHIRKRTAKTGLDVTGRRHTGGTTGAPASKESQLPRPSLSAHCAVSMKFIL